MLYEPDVALSDFALSVETAVFALMVARSPSAVPPRRRVAALLFLCLSLSSLLGAVYHGWFPQGTATAAGRFVWTLTMLSIGGAATVLWPVTAAVAGAAPRWLAQVALALLAAYAAVVLFVDDRFWVSIVFSVPPLVVLLGTFLGRFVRHRSRAAALGLTAVLLMFIASALQQLRIGVHPTYFNHNSLYHVIQGIALALLFYALRLSLQAPYGRAGMYL